LINALHALEKAEGVCGQVTRMRDNESLLSSGAARQYMQDIRRARNLIDGIGTLVSKVDYTDPDFLPEETRSELFHKKQEELRTAKRRGS